MKIGVLGTDDFVTGFRLAGIDASFIVEKDVATTLKKALADEDLGILVMHESDADRLPFSVTKQLEKISRPVIITISERESRSNIRALIKRCIGVDLWRK